jgi:enduracididine biosynthesis enzyme MppQ
MPRAGERALPYGIAHPLSHTRQWRRGVVQEVAPAGILDLGPGYIEPALLPVELVRDAYARALEEYGSAALGYGHNPGALPLRAQLAARATARGGHPCGPEHVVVTAGTSQALYLLATSLAARGDTVLVENLGYDLGQQIFRDCSLRPRRVAMDESGMLPEALDRALADDTPGGDGAPGRIAFVYLTPTHHNPTGATMPLERRRLLLQVAAEHAILVVEDDAYGELTLTDDPAPPPPLAALAGYRGVIRLGSFSKTLGPGLRLGWLETEPALAERIAAHGLFVSGGSLNHIASLAVSGLLADGGYDRHLGVLRARLRLRRDALMDVLRGAMDDRVLIRRPQGGFFLWLRCGLGLSEDDLLARAERAGVRIAAGSRFGLAHVPSVRLAFSFNEPSLLRRAARRLTTAWSSGTPGLRNGEEP